MEKYYALNGNFLGVFVDGAVPADPAAVETPRPEDALQTWNGETWEYGEKYYAAKRSTMKVYRLAFTLALKQSPAPEPYTGNMLTVLRETITNLGPESELAIWWENVTELVRTHPNIDFFASQFGLTAEDVDNLFTLAMSIESSNS